MTTVAVGGGALLVALLTTLPSPWLGRHPWTVAIMALLLVVSELRPIPVPRGDEAGDEISISSTIALAILMIAPAAVAMLVQALALAVDEALDRRAWNRLLFNIGQYTIALSGARAVYAMVAGEPLLRPNPLVPRDVLAALVAAAAFCVLNHGATSTAVALKLRQPVVRSVLTDFQYQLPTSGVLTPMASVTAIAVTWSPWTLPVLLLPIAAVHRSARLAYEHEHEALHDSLTGLPNRSLFNARLDRACRELPRVPFAVLLLDVDHFKDINDTLGHHAGDLLLQEIAQRLRNASREGDLVARLGGDEFAVVVYGVSDASEVTTVTERIKLALAEPLTVQRVRVASGASIGVALAPVDGTNAETLVQRADVALYGAKRNRGSVLFYNSQDDHHSVEKLSLLGELRRGLDDGQVFLVYQPKCDTLTGRVVGAEALVRWRHPTLGTLSPDRFVPLAENVGLIEPLTTSLLDRGLAQLAEWHRRGWMISLAVNLSPRLLADQSLVDTVRSLLAKHGVPPGQLTLEVTENMIMGDTKRTLAVLRGLRDLGVRISIDDFGTGYSSLGYLKRLDVDELKIDRSFVFGLVRDRDDAMIVQTTIELGHHFGLSVVAEGVEDAETLARLGELACDVVQGYHIARPMDAARMTHLLAGRERDLATTDARRFA